MPVTVDSHQHFWRLDRGDYDWLTPDLKLLYRDFSPADLAPLLANAGITKSVVVQATPTVAETRYLLELADQNDFIAGVVGWVDMNSGSRAATDLVALAAHSKFLGIRPMIQDIDDPRWMLNTKLDSVFQTLVDNDLSFDALVKPFHLPYLIEVLERYPTLNLVIDHGAKPNIGAQEWTPWSDDIASIARETGAYCKLSGLVTESGAQLPREDLWPYCQHLLDNFGANRLMWGSDWPVLNLRSNYADWNNDIDRWLRPLAEWHREAIMGKTAIKFYGLSITE